MSIDILSIQTLEESTEFFFYSNMSKNGKRYKTINKGIIYKT